jgi:hypothetical protein
MKTQIAIIPLLLFWGCSTSVETTASIDEAVTQQVLDHHLQTFQANDLDGVMADYTEESVLITPDKTYTGLAEIRDNFVVAFGMLPKTGTTMTVVKSVITKDVAYIVWTASSPTFNFQYATDTFIIQDGKIIRQSYAGVVAAVSGAEADD